MLDELFPFLHPLTLHNIKTKISNAFRKYLLEHYKGKSVQEFNKMDRIEMAKLMIERIVYSQNLTVHDFCKQAEALVLNDFTDENFIVNVAEYLDFRLPHLCFNIKHKGKKEMRSRYEGIASFVNMKYAYPANYEREKIKVHEKDYKKASNQYLQYLSESAESNGLRLVNKSSMVQSVSYLINAFFEDGEIPEDRKLLLHYLISVENHSILESLSTETKKEVSIQMELEVQNEVSPQQVIETIMVENKETNQEPIVLKPSSTNTPFSLQYFQELLQKHPNVSTYNTLTMLNVFVRPIFSNGGYDFTNPNEIMEGYTVQLNEEKSVKFDMAIFKEKTPYLLVDWKPEKFNDYKEALKLPELQNVQYLLATNGFQFTLYKILRDDKEKKDEKNEKNGLISVLYRIDIKQITEEEADLFNYLIKQKLIEEKVSLESVSVIRKELIATGYSKNSPLFDLEDSKNLHYWKGKFNLEKLNDEDAKETIIQIIQGFYVHLFPNTVTITEPTQTKSLQAPLKEKEEAKEPEEENKLPFGWKRGMNYSVAGTKIQAKEFGNFFRKALDAIIIKNPDTMKEFDELFKENPNTISYSEEHFYKSYKKNLKKLTNGLLITSIMSNANREIVLQSALDLTGEKIEIA